MTCPDCDREIYGDKCPCGYRVQRVILQPSAKFTPYPAGLDRDQALGQPLYEAIKLCAAVQMVRRELEGDHVQDRPQWQQVLEQREASMMKDLDELLPKLGQDEQQALLQRFPGVVTA